MEAVLAAEFHDETGLWVVGEQTWCQHRDYPHFRCTVDGFVRDGRDDGEGVPWAAVIGTVQFKTDGRFGWPDGPPANIRAQCIWEMGVTQLQHCWLVVMFAGFRVEVFEIDWDGDAEADWKLMVERADTFWNDHVLTGIPPDADDSDATTEALRAVFPDHEPGVEAPLDGLADLITERFELKDREKATKARLAFIDNAIKAALGEAEVGTLAGLPAFTYRTSERAGYVVDPTTVRTLRPIKIRPTKESL
jgi:predicted phage-related endonuclease